MHISEELETIVAYSREEAMRTGSYSITPDHLFLGILRHSNNSACRILEDLDANLQSLKTMLDDSLFRENGIPYSDESKVLPDRNSRNVLNMAAYEAVRMDSDAASSVHLLIALSRYGNCLCSTLLKSIEIDSGTINAYLKDHAPAPLSTATAEKEPDKKEASFRILGTISVKPSEIYS